MFSLPCPPACKPKAIGQVIATRAKVEEKHINICSICTKNLFELASFKGVLKFAATSFYLDCIKVYLNF